MRTLADHKVNDCNTPVTIEVVDEPGSGGANHRYHIRGYDATTNPSAVCGAPDLNPCDHHDGTTLLFQNGPIKEVGVNGITHEQLLAILVDRLQCFQNGPYACRENALALTKLQEATYWLGHRTKQRLSRGVEGTHAV